MYKKCALICVVELSHLHTVLVELVMMNMPCHRMLCYQMLCLVQKFMMTDCRKQTGRLHTCTQMLFCCLVIDDQFLNSGTASKTPEMSAVYSVPVVGRGYEYAMSDKEGDSSTRTAHGMLFSQLSTVTYSDQICINLQHSVKPVQ